MTGCSIADFFELADQLPEVTRKDNGRYWRIAVSDQTCGYLWEPTRTVGLKQTIAEQLALVAERPETFEVQFTTGGFGWVVVRLEGVSATSWPSSPSRPGGSRRRRRWSNYAGTGSPRNGSRRTLSNRRLVPSTGSVNSRLLASSCRGRLKSSIDVSVTAG